MSKKAWKNQEKIFHRALRLGGEERGSFLLEACAGNEALRSEVISLLEAFEKEAAFLDEPVFEDHLALFHKIDSNVLENSEIGAYRIHSMIGEGGMGKVFDATDIRLNRRVALKFLSRSFDDDNLARRRLLREAQAAAMLDHANICAIYGIEQIEEHHFIAMQYIDGLTLADFIKKSPVERKSVPGIFRQIVSAVAFAHSHGIIHRDLKPANIMIRDDGQIKVLDFGLAKNVGPKAGQDGNLSSRISQNGLIIGTVSYMSPEQLRGERLDFQTDIFSIGIILYELISGRNPFARNSQAETIASVLGDEPPPLTGLNNVSDGLSPIVRKCLEKDKAKRYQSAAEILIHLETAPKHYSQRQTKRKPLFVGAVLLLIALFLFTIFLYVPTPANVSRSLAILPIANESSDPANDYLSDGLTGSITSRLSGISQIRVTAPTLVSRYKGAGIDPVTAGAQLHVDAVVSAGLLRIGDSLYLKGKLINAADGRELADIDFEINKTGLINTQEMIATHIISKLRVSPSEQELEALRKGQTTSAEANEALLQGLYFLNRGRDPENIDKAILFFQKAKDIDPNYAKAWAGLAQAYVMTSLPGYGSLPPAEAMSKARAAAENALRLNDNLSEAYTSMGIIQSRYNWNWSEAEKSFLKAIALDPNSAPAHYWYSRSLMPGGDLDKALAEALKAKELDPLLVDYASQVARVYYCQRQPDKAIQTLSAIREENSNNQSAIYLLGLVYLQQGRDQEALELLSVFYEKTEKSKKYFAAALGYAYGRLKRKQDALRILSDLEKIGAKEVVPPQEKAVIYLGMGEEEKAFELFTRSCDQRYPALPVILTEFFFDPYRNDKRFADLKNCVTPLS